MVQLIVDITPKDWFDYATAFGPIIAALIACGLAWWQGKIQEKQKNISLLNNRLKLMKEIDNYIDSFRDKLIKRPNDDVFWETYIDQVSMFSDYKTKSKIFYNNKISILLNDIEQLITIRQYIIIDLNDKNQNSNKNIFCMPELVKNYEQIFKLKKKIIDEIFSFIERRKI